MLTSWETNSSWKADLRNYIKQGLKRLEILDYMVRDCPSYQWSLRTIARKLNVLNIRYADTNVNVEAVKEAVKQELEGS